MVVYAAEARALVHSMSRDEIHEPRWPAFVAMLAAAFLYLALPEPLSLGPSWLLLAIIFVLLIPIVATYRRGQHNVSRNSHIPRQRRDHGSPDRFLDLLDSGTAVTPRNAKGPAAFGCRALAHEHFGVCPVVLEARRRGSAGTRPHARPRGKLVSFSGK